MAAIGTINAVSDGGKGTLSVAPFVLDGTPKVVIMIKKSTADLIDATLDGEPAVAFMIGEDANGNGPWNFGDLLVRHWEAAKKMAGEK